MMLLNLGRRLEFFLEFGYLHGLRYMGKRCGVAGKLFWMTVLIVSALSMSYIFVLTLQSFEQDVVIVNLDTAYLHWTNTFPAVSVCLARGYSTNKLSAFAQNYFKTRGAEAPKKFPSYMKVLFDYMFSNPSTPMYTFDYCATANETCGVDIEVFKRELLPQHCNQFMSNVEYMGKKYTNCEDVFKKHQTEMGTCFIANSMLTYDLNKDLLPLIYDRSNFERTLSFNYADMEVAQLQLYIHSPELLPFVNMDRFNLKEKGIRYDYAYSTIEMVNSDDVRDTPIPVRGCRFPDERLAGSTFAYSFASCFSDLRIRVELATCNCTLPTSPVEYASQYCKYEGLRCIGNTNIAKMARDLHNREETKCMQSCIEMEITSIRKQQTQFAERTQMGAINIDIINMPSMRYQRNVAKSQLDLVVAVGGVIGLFFGASLLSMVEFVYIWFIRRFNDEKGD